MDENQLVVSVAAVALTLHQTLDLSLTLETLLDSLHELVPYDSASIMLLDGQGYLVIQAARGYDRWLPDAHKFKGTAFPVDNTSLPIFNIYQNQKSTLIPDVRQEPGWQANIGAGADIRNWVGVPLVANGRFIGIISLDKLEPNVFTREHIQITEKIAPHAALAIQNAQLFKAEQSHALKLQQSQAILFQAEKAAALGRLTITISHEINNPVQAIQGCLSLTRDEMGDPNNQENVDRYLDVIEVEARRISTIINNMRSSHPTVIDDNRHPVDINTILDQVLSKNENQINAKKILLKRKWTTNLPLIRANEQNLTQALHNIIANAVEAISNPEQLIVETTLCQPSMIQITIHKTGHPIPKHIQENLFEPFITTKDKQFGLGLFVTYSIIEAHGGQITATSTAEQGTTFTIHLPVPSLP
jgi:signal transduction histidine kinase